MEEISYDWNMSTSTLQLQQNTRTILYFHPDSNPSNPITLAVNSGMSETSRTDNATLIVMFVFVCLIVLVNIVVVIGLMKRKTNQGILKGLIQMYKDKDVDKYYDMLLTGKV